MEAWNGSLQWKFGLEAWNGSLEWKPGLEAWNGSLESEIKEGRYSLEVTAFSGLHLTFVIT